MCAADSAATAVDRPRRRSTLALLLWGIAGLTVCVGLFVGIRRGIHERPDWGDFRYETRYVWEHHATRPGTAMFGYLPAATFVLWPFTVWLPAPYGVVAFGLVNAGLAAATVWFIGRYWLRREAAFVELALPLVLIAGNFAHALSANQLTLVTLFLCVAGLTLVHARRPMVGGALLGLAAVIKTLPALLGLYLILTGRWRALVGLVAAIIIGDILPSVLFFGPPQAVVEHRRWAERASWHDNRRLIEEPFVRVHRHASNAALSAVLTRWLREPPAATRQIILYGDPPADVVARYQAALAPDELLTIDPMPPDDQPWSVRQIPDLTWVPRFHLAAWSARSVIWLWEGIMAAGFLVLLLVTWLNARRTPADWTPLAALWLLAMFWPSPMLRHYYLAWALPALVVVWQQLHAERQRLAGRWSAGSMLAAVSLVVWFVGVFCLGWFTVRWYGIHVLALALLTAATLWAWSRATRERPSA